MPIALSIISLIYYYKISVLFNCQVFIVNTKILYIYKKKLRIGDQVKIVHISVHLLLYKVVSIR